MEPDGALYACIAKTMARTGDFVNLYAVGSDWLDKPHFPFWVTAASFRLLGIHTFAYKFPALLFFLGGVFYTYQFARLAYPKVVAQVAVLVLLTTLHGVLSNSDVRAEPYLTGLIIGAVYHFYRVFRGGPSYHLLPGALLTACALMTKGLFVGVPIGAGLILHWLLTGHWRELLKPRWYIALALSFLFTLPEIYCLYEQFDRHPEKVIFNKTDVSGIRFFVWDSQFGRFFNTGPIKGSGDKLFFVHTLLWAFLPWSLPLYVGVGKALSGAVRRGKALSDPSDTGPEYVSLGSGLATFVLFSLSAFQLPHYLNIVFPFFSVLTAQFVVNLSPPNLRRWCIGQTILGVLLIGLVVGLLVLVQPDRLGLALGWVGLLTLIVFMVFRTTGLLSLMGRMVGAMTVLMGALNLFLLPTFLQYQAGMAAADFANRQPMLSKRPTLLYMPGTGVGGGSFWTYEFNAHAPALYVRQDSALRTQLRQGPQPVFTSAEYADSLAQRGFGVRRLAVFPYYHVSRLTYPFLNRDTRATTLQPYVLAFVSANEQEN